VCGDSSKSKFKTRGSIFLHQGSYIFHCYNCNETWPLFKLIQFIDQGLAKEYSLEKFKDSAQYKRPTHVYRQSHTTTHEDQSARSNRFVSASALDLTHPAKKYLTHRKVEKMDRVAYIENPKEWLDSLGEKTVNDSPQLAFLLKDFKGTWFGAQLRALDSSQSKYRFQTVIFAPGHVKAFGCETINKDAQTLYVVEGATDSLMLDNAVAALDASLHTTASKLGLPKEKTVLVFDNEPSNKQIVSSMEKAIADGWKVVIWPRSIKSKDLNECVCKNESLSFVQSEVYQGLTAKLKLSTWKNT
jgi:hypothetical protein